MINNRNTKVYSVQGVATESVKNRQYLLWFLLFCVASSKSIIIYNEEILVALSFLAFVIFCFYYLSSQVEDSLNARSAAIQQELENSHKQRQENLENLFKQHKRLLPFLRNFAASSRQVVTFMLPKTSAFETNAKTSSSFIPKLNQQLTKLTQLKMVSLQSSKFHVEDSLQKGIASAIHLFVSSKALKK